MKLTPVHVLLLVFTWTELADAYLWQPRGFSEAKLVQARGTGPLHKLPAACFIPSWRTRTGNIKTVMKIPGIEFLVQALSPKPSSFSNNPVVAAVQDRDEGKVRTLITQGVDVNGFDPLFGNSMHWIAEKGHYQYPPSGIPKVLIDAGLDLNAKNPSGSTALEISLLRGWQNIATLLLDSGADRAVVTEAVKSRITCPDCKKVVRDYRL